MVRDGRRRSSGRKPTFDPRKITLICTFHPSQTTEQRFFRKIDALPSRGFKIGMVNYVLTSETLPDFERRCRSLAQRGVPLHPNPLWGSRGAYSSEGRRILHEYLPSFGYGYRTGLRSPLRQVCFFPAVAYQMNPWGRLHVGCHRTRAGSFFNDELPPQFPGPVPCPQKVCVRKPPRLASLKLRIVSAKLARWDDDSALSRNLARFAPAELARWSA